MTAITSAGNGNWNTAGTWSPAQVPAAGDTVTIAAGHTVTYDKNGPGIALAKVTVSGILTFSTSMSTVLEFGDSVDSLLISATGTLNIGTAAVPVPAVHTAHLRWAQGALGRNVFTSSSGAVINIYGDPAYYGGLGRTVLVADWSSGTSFYVAGDASGWQAGQKIYVHSNPNAVASAAAYQTDADFYTVTAVGGYDALLDRTQITCAQDGLGGAIANPVVVSRAGGLVANCSRNVTLGDPGNPNIWDVHWGYSGYTERIRSNLSQLGYLKISIEDCLFYGWNYALASASNNRHLRFRRACIVSSDNVIVGGAFCYLDDCACISCGTIFSAGFSHQVRGGIIASCWKVHSDRAGANSFKDTILASNYIGIFGDISAWNVFKTCSFIRNYQSYSAAPGLAQNCTFINQSSYGNQGTIGLSTSITYEDCMFDGVRRQLMIYAGGGVIQALTQEEAQWIASGGPPSGSGMLLEAVPNSFLAPASGITLALPMVREMAAYASAGEHTLALRIYPYGAWTTELTEADVVLEVSYLDSESGVTRTTTVNVAATYANGGWREVNTAFTVGQAGTVYFRLHINRYESGKTILIDPAWVLI